MPRAGAETVSGAGLTASVRVEEVALSGVAAASVTLTVKLAATGVVGVPEITPAWLRLSPAGSVPEARVHVRVPLPPVATSVTLYAVPTVPPANAPLVVIAGAGCTVMLTLAVCVVLFTEVAVSMAVVTEETVAGAV